MRFLDIKKGGLVANLFLGSIAMLFATSLLAKVDVIQPSNKGMAAPPGAPKNQSAMARPKMQMSAADSGIRSVAPQACVPAKGQFAWNFENEDLLKVLKQVSDLLCRSFVIHDSISPSMKMTIIGKSLLTAKDAWDVLVAALAQKGLALVQQGERHTWTVVRRADSKNYSTPFYTKGRDAKNNEEIGTLFYKAVHTSQDTLKNIGRMLISKDGMVETVGDQFVIVIDSNSNIRRLGYIFSQVDLEDAQNRIHVVKLMNADAKVVEKQLRELFDVSPASTRTRRRSKVDSANKITANLDKIIADDRTNSLILVGDKESFDKVQQVINLLDTKDVNTNKGTIHVKRLRYADAKKIADTLNSVLQQNKSLRSRFGRREENTNELFEGEVKITAHEDTNTLVTVASSNDYRSLLSTIEKLDIRKEQVYVEAVIMDINVSDTNKFGVSLFNGVDQGIIPGLGGSVGILANPGGQGIASGISTALTTAGKAASEVGGLGKQSIGALAVLGNFLSGGVAGIIGPSVGNTAIPSFGAVLQAIATNSNIDVLSTPYLLTTDNQEAVMSVGQKVPVIKGASSVGGNAGLGGVPLQTINYEDVKLTFKVTPHVGADNNVRLDIEQEVNELGQKEKLLNADQYRISTKSAKTTIVLKDQQTGVIGGLIHNRSTTIDNKTPFLGDIPILGWLFKNRSSETERKSLTLILTPYIIRSDYDYEKIVERKLKEREEFANLYYGGKIQNYNKTIDYDKKSGPLSSMILALDA
ncbi:MAG: type II secretion system secretin GspD, partial [Myxococcales bacterium]|nr:type II secretion system secretin GspD [Myxococcales bacterium]